MQQLKQLKTARETPHTAQRWKLTAQRVGSRWIAEGPSIVFNALRPSQWLQMDAQFE
jgi:hypothetical protein